MWLVVTVRRLGCWRKNYALSEGQPSAIESTLDDAAPTKGAGRYPSKYRADNVRRD